jgi:hypothetical protein
VRQVKHGHACRGQKSLIYLAWVRMNSRCYNQHYHRFHRYGGRGVRVCDRWRNDFEAFLDDVPAHPGPGYSLHRINNDGDYEPGNVKWATVKEQACNSSRPVGITGLRGVWLAGPHGKYRASIIRDGKCHHIGTFNSPQAASKAYEQAKAALAKAA